MTNKDSQLFRHGTRAAATTAATAENTNYPGASAGNTSYPTTRRPPWTPTKRSRTQNRTTATMKAKLTLEIYTLDVTTTSVLIGAKSRSRILNLKPRSRILDLDLTRESRNRNSKLNSRSFKDCRMSPSNYWTESSQHW